MLVKNDVVIGEGWHRKTGDAHAEVNALADASGDVSGATANDFVAVADLIDNTADEYDICRQFRIDGSLTKTSTPDTDCWGRTR